MPIHTLPAERVLEEEAHASEHQDGGVDEINVSNLSGELADKQPPKTHAPTHKAGNSDELSIADLADIFGVSEIKMGTAANLTAGTGNRLCIETDTGRVLYDNGTSFVEVGLSENQIALGNLGSHAHSELSGIGASDHHAKTVSADIDHANITGVTANQHHDPSAQDVDSVDGYDIQKDGASGTGIINFKTS